MENVQAQQASTVIVKTKKTENKQKINLKYMRDKDREKVKGIFRFHEVPGGTMSFPFRAYKEDPVEQFTLVDGQVYELPLGVARHLNKNCWYPEYEYLPGNENIQGIQSPMGASGAFSGGYMQRAMKKIRRCSFQSLEFVDIEDLTPTGAAGIAIVEAVE